jgi:hypothetical protein
VAVVAATTSGGSSGSSSGGSKGGGGALGLLEIALLTGLVARRRLWSRSAGLPALLVRNGTDYVQ